MPTVYAHYFATKTRKYLIISKAPSIRAEDRIEEIEVAGKRQARQIADDRHCICWNF